jgi:hypothetical protein
MAFESTLDGVAPSALIFERWILSDGHEGVIVQEADERTRPRAAAAVGKAPRRKAAKSQPATAEASAAPALTPGELRAFKAIGRKVRRLCRDKEALVDVRLSAVARPAPLPEGNVISMRAPDSFKPLLLAFDLTVLLGADFDILKIVEGRPQRFGWNWPSLKGQPASSLFQRSSRLSFERMTARLYGVKAGVTKETVIVAAGEGTEFACRAVLGRWPHAGADFFLALLSLDMPERIRKQLSLAKPLRKAA